MKKLILTILILFAFQTPVEAQLFEKIKKKVTQKKNQKENESIDKGIETVEGIFKKKNKKRDDGGGGNGDASGSDGDVVMPGMNKKEEAEIWMTRYDFKPGKDIIFFDDFEGEELGEIPSKWHYYKGLMEIVKVNGENNYVLSGDLGGGHPNWEPGFVLPEAYTIEFDVFMADPNADNKGYGSYSYYLTLYTDDYRSKAASIDISHGAISIKDKIRGKVPGVTASDLGNTWNHISISVNGTSVKAYFNDYRTFNTRIDGGLPSLFAIWNCCQTTDKPVFLIDNFKVAAGAHPKYKEEVLEGKIVTNNIHFQTGSAQIIPRSYAEIKRIADVMLANPNKKFRIEGHTDNVGDDSSNLELSKKRSNAVKIALTDMGVDASLLNSEGYGEAIPVEDNDTPEGRAMNRRVEFIVL